MSVRPKTPAGQDPAHKRSLVALIPHLLHLDRLGIYFSPLSTSTRRSGWSSASLSRNHESAIRKKERKKNQNKPERASSKHGFSRRSERREARTTHNIRPAVPCLALHCCESQLRKWCIFEKTGFGNNAPASLIQVGSFKFHDWVHLWPLLPSKYFSRWHFLNVAVPARLHPYPVHPLPLGISQILQFQAYHRGVYHSYLLT